MRIMNQNKDPQLLLKIFEAYNLCDADALGRLVREEMLVALEGQSEIDWEIVGDNSLKERRDCVHKLPAYKDIWN